MHALIHTRIHTVVCTLMCACISFSWCHRGSCQPERHSTMCAQPYLACMMPSNFRCVRSLIFVRSLMCACMIPSNFRCVRNLICVRSLMCACMMPSNFRCVRNLMCAQNELCAQPYVCAVWVVCADWTSNFKCVWMKTWHDEGLDTPGALPDSACVSCVVEWRHAVSKSIWVCMHAAVPCERPAALSSPENLKYPSVPASPFSFSYMK